MNRQYIESRRELIEKYLKKDPEIPTRTLARRLFELHPDFFHSLESARGAIKLYRGEDGIEKRHLRKTSIKKRTVNTPIGNIVPDSYEPPEKIEPVNLKLNGHGTIISDVHVPYHDKDSVVRMLEYTEKHDSTDFLLINGDFMDFYTASNFNKNPKARRLIDELDMTVNLLEGFTKHFDRVIYKLGNHERRWQSYLFAEAPEISDLPCLSYQHIFRAKELNIHVIEPQQIMYAGKYLTILHGHEFGGNFFSPVNPARGAYLRAKNNCIVGHHHRPSEHVEIDIRGNVTSTFSLGCLSQLRAPYAPARSSYVHGFATMHISGNDFEVDNHRMTEGGKIR